MIEQENLPLLNRLREQINKERYSFHVPGHKNGYVLPKYTEDLFLPLLQIDSTELTELDDLHDPQGVIQEAEKLTSRLYHSQRTFFLVGGSTVGNLAMILAACKENDVILVQRDSHKSIMNGCKLAKVKPIFLSPDLDGKSGLYYGVSYATVKQAIVKYPNAKAIVLTYPSYFGISYDIEPIIQLAHTYNIAVLVDEAHGAHFCLGKPFPRSALDLGADVVVQSAHKTLPAMTMSAYLQVGKGSFISEEKVKKYLQMLQSSSPSYTLLASLDMARSYLASITDEFIKEVESDILDFRKQLDEIPQWTVVTSRKEFLIDLLKITLQTNCVATGIEIQKRLESHGIYVELADEHYLLLVMPLAPFKKQEVVIDIIREAVRDIPLKSDSLEIENLNLLPQTKLELSYVDMDNCTKKCVPIQKAVGEISGETIVPYPPGIPLIMQGERITEGMVSNILKLAKKGIRFQGHPNIENSGIYILEQYDIE